MGTLHYITSKATTPQPVEVTPLHEPNQGQQDPSLAEILWNVVDVVSTEMGPTVRLDCHVMNHVCGASTSLLRLFTTLIQDMTDRVDGEVEVAAWQASMDSVMVSVGGAAEQVDPQGNLTFVVAQALAAQMGGSFAIDHSDGGMRYLVELRTARLAA